MKFYYVATAYPPNEKERSILAIFESEEEAKECISRFETRFHYEKGEVESYEFFKEGEY